ncbi:MAG: hypothetical protein L6R37_008110 [Teloschistes peruensis]|nr:MAG: hypothetical protein L6R37_008110 [Teloschistes peruensis]
MVIFIQAASVQFNPNADFEYVCTAGVYWSMIESGLALCAACLPVQYGLTKSQGVQSMVGSLQSAISLHSRSSPKGSAQRSKHSPHGSQEHIVIQVGAGNDGHALEMGGTSPMDGIIVTQSLEVVGDQRQENEEIRTGPCRV